MIFDLPWYVFTVLYIFVAVAAVIKAKMNKQWTWFWVLCANLLIGVVLASGASLPIAVIYLVLFNKPAKK